MNENDNNTILLVDEEGKEIEFKLIITIEREGTEYALLSNTDDNSEDMFAFRIEKDDEGEMLIPVDNDEEINMIQNVYEEILSE